MQHSKNILRESVTSGQNMLGLKNNFPWYFLVDCIAIIAFAIMGTTAHDIHGGWMHKFLVAMPYLMACTVAYGIFFVTYRGKMNSAYSFKNFLLDSVLISIGTMLLGMILRSTIMHQTTPILFVFVGGSFLVIFMFIWRLVYIFLAWRILAVKK